MQRVINPSFEDGFAPWSITGSFGLDPNVSGVRAGDSRSGTNAYVAVGTATEWFADFTQTLVLVPNTAYKFEMWAKSATPGCTVQFQLLGKADGLDTQVTYTSITLEIPAEDVTPEIIAASESRVLIDIFCNAGIGPEYAVYVDDITVTVL